MGSATLFFSSRDTVRSIFFRFFAPIIIGVIFFAAAPATHAAITVAGPPIDGLFQDATIGGGAYIPLVQFRLQQTSGVETLTSVAVAVTATTTIYNLNAGSTNGAVNNLFLYRESGAHFGFQPGEDILTNTGANAVTDPATTSPRTITVDAGQGAVGTVATDYYVVARATTTAVLVTGHAVYATTSANWISTSGGALGSPFTGMRKATFQPNVSNIKISEVRRGTTGNAGNQFIELYNTSDVPIDLSRMPLNLFIYNADGGMATKTITYFNRIIPARGFFLIASDIYDGSSVPADATYASAANTLISNGGFSISTTTTATGASVATTSAIDLIAWGTQPLRNAASSTVAGLAAPTALADLALDKSYERKATTSSTNTSLAPGGFDSTNGNSTDSRFNNNDFVLQPTSGVNPQNSLSPPEFTFSAAGGGGGGGGSEQKLSVASSFPGPNQISVPIDISFIGFNFSKNAATGTIISATATTTVTLTGGGPNLCASVTYNPFPSNFEPQAKCILTAGIGGVTLSQSTTYTFTVSTNVRDQSGVQLDQDHFTEGNQSYSITFTTGGAGQTQTNTTPPMVIGTTPFQGSVNMPTNLAKILVKFNQSTMDATTLTAANIGLTSSGGSVALSSFSFDATTSLLSFAPGSLSANTQYTLTVGGGVRSSNGISLPMSYTTMFTTGANADLSGPSIVGIFPAASSTTLALNMIDFVFMTDDYLDPSTATSGAVTLSYPGNDVNSNKLPGTVSYDPVAKEGHFTATNPLPANAASNLVLTIATGTLRNMSGIQIGYKAFNYSTEAVNSDATPPTALFANADAFGIAVTFNEAVKATDATNLANYEVSVANATTTLSALAGHKITYDASKRTAQISGLFLQPSASFRVIVSNVKDISGNAMTVSSSVTGTVLSVTQSGGTLGPGGGGDFGPKMNDFSSSGIGFAPGLQVMPMNQFISASTTYGFMIPLSKQIPANGAVVVTFPSSSDFGVCCAATSSTANPMVNEQNKDINGPGTGIIGINVLAKDTTAKTLTLTLSSATRSENSDTHDMLQFALAGVKNPSVPKGTDSSGYSLDIKTKDASGTLLESFTSNPIYISGGAIGGSSTTTIQGTVSGNGGNLQDVTIRLMAPQIGVLETTTDANGLYQFTSLPVNNQVSSYGGGGTGYMLFTDPIVSSVKVGGNASTTVFFGEPMPTPVNATSTSIITRNFSLTATSSALNFGVKLTGDNSSNGIFTSGEQIDIFAGGPNRFIVQTYTTTATNYNGTTIITLPIPQVNGSWGVGVGPAMPKATGGMTFGAPPNPTWIMPKPIELVVSGCPSACVATVGGQTTTSTTFTVSAANRTIAGILKDASGNVISGAEVFAYSPSQGNGSRAQTSSSGVFSMKVGDGSYNVGAFVPGIESSRSITVVVSASGVFVDGSTTASTGSSGANPFVFTMKKPGFTITGRVSDGTNAVANASVFAYRTDGPGHANGVSDSSGNYTLYVDNGAWKVSGFIPGFGPMPEQSVTVSGASKANINFSPSTSITYRTFTGIVFDDANNDGNIATSTEGVSGVVVRVSGANGTNEAITGSDGIFTIRVPSGSYTITDIFKPGYGRIAPMDHTLAAITTLNLASADLYKPIRIPVRRTITVTVKDNTGAAVTVNKAFIDLFDIASGFGNHGEITNGTTTTLQVPDGASTTIRAFIEGVPQQNISLASDDAGTLVLSGVLQVNGNEAIKITLNTTASGMVSISGKVYAGSIAGGNELADAWVQFVDPTNNMRFGTQATSSGIFVVRAATSTYQIQPFKPGYVGVATSVAITANTAAVNLVLTQGSSNISGTVTAGGSGVSNAFVWAEKLGGGFASAKTNASGAYTLSVDSGNWKLFAATDGAQKTAYSGNPVAAGATNITIPLTVSTALITKLSTSNTFSDTSTGSFTDSTVGVKVGLDSGALGSSGTQSYLSAKKTTNVPASSDTNILGDAGWDISAVNGSSAVTNLATGKKAEITLTMTKADLTAEGVNTTTAAAAVSIVSWSDDKKTWESLGTVPTYRDSTGAAVTPTSNLSNVSSIDFTTSGASHFSAYALSSPTNDSLLAPATPSGFAVSQTSGAVSAALRWTANTEADLSGYFVYRDTSSSGTFPLRATLGVVTSFTDTVDAGTTYYYKIASFNTANLESAATAASSLAVTNATAASTATGGGGSPTIGQTTPTPTPTPAASTPAASTATKSVVTAPTPGKTTTTAAPGLATALSRVTNPVALQVLKNLAAGSRGTDVRNLQEMLKSDFSIYPEAIVNGNFGPATLRAVKKFQQKYGIKPVNGRVGPMTRAKLQEVFGGAMAVPAPIPATIPTPSGVGTPTTSAGAGGSASIFVKDLAMGSRNDDVRRLQQLLATDPEIYPEGIMNGNFGGATQRAIKRFQAKYGITQNGRVGPMTRAKLQEVFGGAESSEAQKIKDQIAETIKEIERLRAAATTATTTPAATATSSASVTATSTAMTTSTTTVVTVAATTTASTTAAH